ncbi:MAG: GatB/YqeY domain-containing protein [Planctomycetes bacterium]|nr:GatB/YqeY domain-containing protein [Planctomycetota bacterium]
MLDKLREDMKAAMKAREELRLSTIRMVIASIKTVQIDKGEDLSEGDILGILQKAIKSRKDSVEQYEKAGRTDLAEKEKAEIAVLEEYLPQQMSEDDVRALVQKIIEEEGAESKGDIGKVMRRIMADHKGAVDGKRVNQIANELLS